MKKFFYSILQFFQNHKKVSFIIEGILAVTFGLYKIFPGFIITPFIGWASLVVGIIWGILIIASFVMAFITKAKV